MKTRRCLTPDEVKCEELRILKAFDAFCRSRDLSYSLAGGTLLGAVRHKGFIPWDDDIDVAMGRPYYDKLLELQRDFEAESGFKVVPFRGTKISTTPYIKIINPLIWVQADIEMFVENLWIDVFPIDALPVSEIDLRWLYARASLRRKLIIISGVKPESGSTPLKRLVKRAIKKVLSIPGVIERQSLRLNSLARDLPYGSTPYVGGIAWGLYGAGERVSLEGFDSCIPLSFEGYDFSCMSCWDDYLTGLYGEYMRLPSEDMRKSHDVVAWREVGGGD